MVIIYCAVEAAGSGVPAPRNSVAQYEDNKHLSQVPQLTYLDGTNHFKFIQRRFNQEANMAAFGHH